MGYKIVETLEGTYRSFNIVKLDRLDANKIDDALYFSTFSRARTTLLKRITELTRETLIEKKKINSLRKSQVETVSE